jgi:hypothetical protein
VRDDVVARVVSGGQSGVDRAALDAAIACGVSYGGWCPAGGWAEDLPEPPGLIVEYPKLIATTSADPDVRTRLNVRASDATLLVDPSRARSRGTNLTRDVAIELGRPHLDVGDDPWEALAWLRRLGSALTVNIAGPRESEHPGSYRSGYLLTAMLLRLDRRPGVSRT